MNSQVGPPGVKSAKAQPEARRVPAPDGRPGPAQQKKRGRRVEPNRRPLFLGGGVALLVIGAIVAVALWNGASAPAASGAIQGLLSFTSLERGHTEAALNYPQLPPVGGSHSATWLNCGVYGQAVKNENAVHDLEHGAVWITYQPGLDTAELESLRTITRQSAYRLLTPYPGLPSPIVVSAWGYQLRLSASGDPRLLQFIQQYEQSPRGPEPGAPCSGGTGTPLK